MYCIVLVLVFVHSMRSFRLAQNSFAAEAAVLTTISDEMIRSWNVTPDFPRKSEVIGRIKNLLDQCQCAKGRPSKAAIAYTIFRLQLEHISDFAYSYKYLDTQSKKSEELRKDCERFQEDSMYTNEERMHFLRLNEFLKCYKVLVDRVLAIHHNLSNPVVQRRYPLRSNRGVGNH
jgi:hypothetical protein